MPTQTYIPLATKTLTSSASSVTFSSISQSYRDLILVGANINPTLDSAFAFRLNNNSNAGAYDAIYIRGNGSATSTNINTSNRFIFADNNVLTNGAQNFYFHLMDYSASDKHKPVLFRGNDTSATYAGAGRLNITTAISTVQFFLTANQISAGATFTLYGVIS